MKRFFGYLMVAILAVATKVTTSQQIDFFTYNNIPMPNNMEFNELQAMVAPGLQQSLQVAIDAFTANMPNNQMSKLVGVSTLLNDLCAEVKDIQAIDVYMIQLGCGGGLKRQLEVKLPQEAVALMSNHRELQNQNEIIAFLLSIIEVLLDAFCCFCFLFETTSPSECICECASNPFPLPTEVPAMVPFDFPSFEPILPSFLPGPTDEPSMAPITPAPTPEPTTSAPTDAPTPRPTPEPTATPTAPPPTFNPTPRPTPEPTMMPTNPPCPICGLVGGSITNGTNIISGVMNMTMTCDEFNEQGIMNNIMPPLFCDVLQDPNIAVDVCGCTGFLTPEPTTQPSPRPTSMPTPQPTTATPTATPTASPTPEPTPQPTTATPTNAPTFSPTPEPTTVPTGSPTPQPTVSPTPGPTNLPTGRPSPHPTPDPTPQPTNAPCPVCGLLGGMITEPQAVVNMDPFVTMTCEQVDSLGLEGGIPAMECNTIQTAVARDTCKCSGSFTPEPTGVPTAGPTPEPTMVPTPRPSVPPSSNIMKPSLPPSKDPTQPSAPTSGKGKSGKGKSSSGKGKSSSGKGKSSSGKGKSSKGKGKSSGYSDDEYGDDHPVDHPAVSPRDLFPTPAPVQTETTTAEAATNDSNTVPVWVIPAVFAGTIVIVLVIMAVRRRRPSRSSRGSSSRRSSSRSRSGSSRRSSSQSPTGASA